MKDLAVLGQYAFFVVGYIIDLISAIINNQYHCCLNLLVTYLLSRMNPPLELSFTKSSLRIYFIANLTFWMSSCLLMSWS